MFKKSTTIKQHDLFSSPSGLMCKRESRKYDNPAAWHNKFYRDVTCNIDEEIFRPLFAKELEDGKDGRSNAPIRILIAMSILKEGCGCSDETLYENYFCCLTTKWLSREFKMYQRPHLPHKIGYISVCVRPYRPLRSISAT